MGEPLSNLSSALYTHADVAGMTEILTTSLAGLLPADVVQVKRRRTTADRLHKRPGRPVELSFLAGDQRLTLRSDEHGRPESTIEHVVRGVRLSQQRIGIDEWIAALTAELRRLAAEDELARETLYRFLLG